MGDNEEKTQTKATTDEEDLGERIPGALETLLEFANVNLEVKPCVAAIYCLMFAGDYKLQEGRPQQCYHGDNDGVLEAKEYFERARSACTDYLKVAEDKSQRLPSPYFPERDDHKIVDPLIIKEVKKLRAICKFRLEGIEYFLKK
jgi:hypothetical protein